MPKEIEKPEMTLGEFFGPEGLLARTHPQYEFRQGQLTMAEAVEQAFQQKKHLVVEAGTGTGKTLAYLIPALRSGRKVVISTGTKTLQEQLFFKDIPFLKEHLNAETRAAHIRGRTNFLCRQKLYDLEHQPVLKGLEELDHYARIREWEKTTETGDRAELRDLPDPIPLRRPPPPPPGAGGRGRRTWSSSTPIFSSPTWRCAPTISAASCPTTPRSSSTKPTSSKTSPASTSASRSRTTAWKSWRATRRTPWRSRAWPTSGWRACCGKSASAPTASSRSSPAKRAGSRSKNAPRFSTAPGKPP